MQRPIGTIFIVSAMALLAACGGGGGGGGSDTASDAYDGPTERVAVTDSNDAARVAGDTFTTVDSVVFTTARAAPSSSLQPPALGDLGQFMKRPHNELLAKAAQCPDGGTADANSSGDGTAGSTSSISYNDCRVGSLLFNGSFSGKVVSGDVTSDTYTARITFDHYTVQEVSAAGKPTGNYFEMHGDVTVAESSNGTSHTIVVSGAAFYSAYADISYGINTKTLLQDFKHTDDETWAGDLSTEVEATVSSTLIGGTVVVHTVTPFVTPSGEYYPQSGQGVITAANKVKVRVTADGAALLDTDHVTIEWDLDADGLYEDSRSGYWGQNW